MVYTTHYVSPLGDILLAGDEVGLCGLWFAGQTHFAPGIAENEGELPVFAEARRWLDTYFAGDAPDFVPPLHLCGTAFQREVWDILRTIPYGGTVTYGELAAILAGRRGVARFSAQAVGGAVGRNPVSIILPCHRVVGAGGRLTGYAGGLARKAALLELEGMGR